MFYAVIVVHEPQKKKKNDIKKGKRQFYEVAGAEKLKIGFPFYGKTSAQKLRCFLFFFEL